MWEKLKIVMSKVWAILLPTFRRALKDGVQLLIPIAIAAVKAAQEQGGTWTEKRDFAYNYALEKALRQGIPIVIRDINEALVYGLNIVDPKQ